MKKRFFFSNSGQSIIEIVIAMAIFVTVIGSFSALLIGNFSNLNRGFEILEAHGLLSEAYEALRSIRARAWNEIKWQRSAIDDSTGMWQLMGEGATEQIGKFSRLIDFLPVFRDSSGELVASTSALAREDVLSKRIIFTLSWELENNQTKTIEQSTMFTDWMAEPWSQTDWSGGNGQSVWSGGDRYFSDDENIEVGDFGEIKLKEIATGTYALSGQLESAAFDTGKQASFSAIMWEEIIPPSCGACQVKIQIKTTPDASGVPDAWPTDWSGPDGEDGDEVDFFTVSSGRLISIDHNTDQWIKYRVILEGEGNETPVLEDIIIYYQ